MLRVAVTGEAEPWVVNVASESVNVYAEVCNAAGADLGDCPIEYRAVPESQTGSVVSLFVTAILPVLLIGAFIYFFMRNQQNKAGPG